jgi:small subunit ribosomal protein S7
MRTKKTYKNTHIPDAIYHSVEVTKLINRIMKQGKKSVAAKLVYQAFDQIKEKLNQNPLDIFEVALKNITPQIEVRSRRVGGAAYQVPMPVRSGRGFSLAVRWLVAEANKRPNKEFHTFSAKLAAEIMDAINNQGGAIQKKITAHKMADANKAFAHFRW